MKITIRKIAEAAGVSRGTVDRVLNNRPGVKHEVRERILEIMADSKFEPNKAAKALAYNKKPAIIGIIMPPRTIAFYNDIRKGIEAAYEELKDFGIIIEYRYVSNKEPKDAVTAIGELVNMGVSGLILAVMDDDLVRCKVDDIIAGGIPVVTFNSDITNCKRICFVGQDLYKSGRVAAGLMSKVLENGANILAVTGNMEFHAHKARIEGFNDRLKEIGQQLKVVKVEESFDLYEETYKKVAAAINFYKDIKGIYMATGDVKACVDVIKSMDISGKVHIICNDLLPEVSEYMQKGIIDFTIIQNPFLQGYKPMKILYEYIFTGKMPENEYIYTEIDIRIGENI